MFRTIAFRDIPDWARPENMETIKPSAQPGRLVLCTKKPSNCVQVLATYCVCVYPEMESEAAQKEQEVQ